MTVPHVQLKYQKCVLASIGSAVHWGGCELPRLICLCVSAVHRKIKIQNKFKSQGEMVLGGSTATLLLPYTPLAYSIENAPLFFFLSLLLVSRADK